MSAAFRRVVIGIDFTERSLAAARWVAMHLAPEAELVLVHVLRRPEAPAFLSPMLETMCGVVAEVAPALHDGLRHVAEQLGPERTRLDMRDGPRAEALAGAAEESGADLICIGGMQHRRGSARFGANLPLRVMARSRLPLLVVPPSGVAASGQRRVVAAVDDRPDDVAVLRTAAGASTTRGARLDVVHVLSRELQLFVRAVRPDEHDVPHSFGDLELIADPARHRIRDEAHLLWLAHAWIARQLDAAGVATEIVDARTHVRVGDPGQEIVRLAGAGQADLIVVGRGGPALSATAGAGWLPVGSTARLVSWAAPCPVLVLAPQPAPRAPAPAPRGRSRMPRPDVTDRIAVSTVAPGRFPPAASRTVA